MKLDLTLEILPAITVTPLAGVWIEINLITGMGQPPQSHPSRVCGLKSLVSSQHPYIAHVTPLAGVWIEMIYSRILSFVFSGHTPRGCVD